MKKYGVYPVLERQANLQGITKASMARFLGISNKTIYQKASGGSHFTLEEAKAIQKNFFPNIPLDILFESGEEERDE